MTRFMGFRSIRLISSGIFAAVAALVVFPGLVASADRPGGTIQPIAGEAGGKADDLVTGKAFLSVDRLPGGGQCRVVMVINIADGWHIKTNPARPRTFIPTQLTVKSKHGTVLKDVRYPEGKDIAHAGAKEPIMVYENQVMLYGVLAIPKEAAGQSEELEISVRYQACKGEDECLLPKTIKLTGKLDVADPGETVKQINSKYFAAQASK